MRLVDLMLQRCPRCRRGRPFHGVWQMHPACPECGLAFEREPGYWLGALYMSYALGLALVVPTAGALFAAEVASHWIVLAAVAQLLLQAPLVYRYARLAWMYLDQAVDPR